MFIRSGYTQKINQKIAKIRKSTDVNDIRSLPDFEKILANNPHAQFVQGYYVEIPLSEYQTFVPNAPLFPDRYGKAYTGGQFDAPLFDLHEWRENWQKGHPKSNRPDLLVNANWFNVWDTGIANKGQKINPRKQDRTYLIGLSVSSGKMVSSHQVLDQENIGLDTIVFDEASKKAKLMFHQEIETLCGDQKQNRASSKTASSHSQGNIFENKNAVSGFIILQNGQMIPTPKLNNNHNNRLPRTGVGLKNDGKNAVILVIHNTKREYGVTADEFAQLFSALKCDEAINLDNSGSVELYYRGPGHFGKKSVFVRTKTCDAGTSTERPKPNCLGFKNTCNTRFFAADDSDIARKKEMTDTVKSKDDGSINYTYYIKR